MGKFHHFMKNHGDKKKSSSSRPKYDLTQSGRKKLPEDFLFAQSHKSIWNSFSNFLDERFAEEDFSEILDEDDVIRIKTAPAIPPMLHFEPQIPGEVESEESKARTITRGQVLCRERSTVLRRNKEASLEIQSSNCVSAQAHRCTYQLEYASVFQVYIETDDNDNEA